MIQNLLLQKNLHQSTLIEVKLIATTHYDTKSRDGDIPFVAVFLAHMSFIIAWGIVVHIVSWFCKSLEDPPQNKDEIVSIKTVQQHPCINCHYFHRNSDLKCAVHPSIALTKEAWNCCDRKSR